MSKLSNLGLGAVAALMLCLPAAAQDKADVDTVVATVNGVDITIGHIALARASLPDQYKQLPANVLFEGLRDQLIQQTVLAQSLETLPRRLEVLIENDRRTMIAGEALSMAAGKAVTEADIQAVYDRDFASVPPGKEYNASHILMKTEDEAKAAIERIDAGEDFADLARELSTGPSGPNGGQLGWFGTGQMVQPFEEAVVAMEAGTVSAPVQTEFGWHVIRLNEVRDAAVPGLDEVRADLKSQLERQAAETIVASLVEGADVAKVDGIDPEVIVNPDLFSE